MLEVQANEEVDFDGEGMWLQGVFMLILNISQRMHPQKYRGSGLAILEVTWQNHSNNAKKNNHIYIIMIKHEQPVIVINSH